MKKHFLFVLFLVCISSCDKDSTELTGNWTKRPGGFEGGSRQDAVAFSMNGKGYIGLGYNSTSRLKGMWEYTPENDQWTSKANFIGEGRNGAIGFSIGSKGYVGLGFGDTTDDYLADFYEFDPESNSWTRKADFPGGARKNLIAFSIGNKGYVGTGYGYDPEVEDGKSAVKYFNDLWEYDPSGTDDSGANMGTWRKINGFPGEQRSAASVFVINNKAYVGMGISSSGSYPIDFYQFDPASGSTGKWTRVASVPSSQGRQQAVAFAINGKGYVSTGTGSGGANDLWEYDPATDEWTQRHNFEGSSRYAACGFAIGNYGYVGLGTGSVNDFWRLNPTAEYIDSSGDDGDENDPW